MAYLYIMCGLAFAGKTTLAKKITEHTGAVRIAFDEIWVTKEKENLILKGDERWKIVRKFGLLEVEENLKLGSSIVYDDNNPRFEHREQVRKIAEKLGVKSIVIYLNTPVEIIREREASNKISKNRHEVESVNFQNVLNDLEPPSTIENYIEFTPTTNLEEFLQKL